MGDRRGRPPRSSDDGKVEEDDKERLRAPRSSREDGKAKAGAGGALVSDERNGPRAGFCPRCGALNGVDFDRCIRCGAALSARAVSADHARSHLDGRSLLGTKAIIGVTIVIFAFQTLATVAQKQSIITGSSTRDALRFGAILVDTAAVATEPWRLISAIFVHYGVLHIGMNMLGLANLGRIAEPAVGTARFVIAYLFTGVIGFATTVLYAHFSGGTFGTTAGASGAVLGMMGVVLGWLIRKRDPRWKDFAVQALFYGVLFGFAVNASSMGIMVNNSAHIGGLLSGTLFGIAFAGARPRSDLWTNLVAGVAVVACVVSLVLPHWSPLGQKIRLLSEAPLAPSPVSARDAGSMGAEAPWSAPPG